MRLFNLLNFTRKEKVVTIEKIVPVSNPFGKTRDVLLNDIDYINGLSDLGQNPFYITEIISALSRLRDCADIEKSPDKLSGINCGIAEIKNLLVITETARACIRRKTEEVKINAIDSGVR